ncbi:hypothetical protein ACWCWD_26955 [Streptomyces sp. NPDC001493]
MWGRGCGVGAVCGLLAAALACVLIGRAWTTCDIGGGSYANSLTLVVLFVPLWLVGTLCWVLPYGLLGRRFHGGWAVAAGTAATLFLVWFAATWLGMPDDYPAPFCADNVPGWWPVWIPA